MENRDYDLLLTAIEWLQTINQEDTFDSFLEKIENFQELKFNYSMVEELIKDYDDQVKINLLTAYFLIYIFSNKYPNEIWDEDITNIVDQYRTKYKDYQKYLDSLNNVHNPIKKLNDEHLQSIFLGVKGSLVNALLKVSNYKNYNVIEDLTYIAIFKDKPGGSIYTTPLKWLNMLKAILNENSNNIEIKSSMDVETKFYDLHSLSVKGSSHSKCDDSSNVVKIDDTTWAAFCADGLGSRIMSHIGSELAGKGFIESIKETHLYFKKKGKYYSANMMYYIQYELAKNIAKYWKKHVETYIKENEKNYKKELEISDFASTLLIAFGCKDFVVCGMVGDGNLIVEKNPVTSLDNYGYMKMDDCFSDVVQKSVLNTEHLLDKPYIMQFKFFKPEEISGIVLASDGANAMFYREIDEVLYPNLDEFINISFVFKKFRSLNFNDCKNQIESLCKKFVQGNRFGGGRDDDCTIVYIKSRGL